MERRREGERGKGGHREGSAGGGPAKALRLDAALKSPGTKSRSDHWGQETKESMVRLEAKSRQGLCRKDCEFRSLSLMQWETLE